MVTRTKDLLQDLDKSRISFYNALKNPQQQFSNELIKPRKRPPSSIRLAKQRALSRSKYEDLTNMTKQEQQQMIWQNMQSQKKSKKDWSYAHYTGNNKNPHNSKTFSVFQNKYLEQFPDNNTKYNIQFLDRSLHGTSLKFPRSQSGEFKKPSYSLYSKRYQPIVNKKIQFNEEWQLRASKFGKIWVDHKRDRIINQYQLQSNPFKTPKSNSLISKLSKSQIY